MSKIAELVSHLTSASYMGMGAAIFGFAGAIIILIATLRTVRLRRAILESYQIKSSDPRIKEGVAVLLGKLTDQQLTKLHQEHRLSLIGAALLAIGFAFGFIRELI